MLITLLTFGWFPLFFVFLALFVAKCREEMEGAPIVDEAGRKRLGFSAAARRRIYAACLVPSVMAFVSCGIYSIVGLGFTTWAIAFFFGALVVAVIACWGARYFVVEATYDDRELCSKFDFGRAVCLPWSDVATLSFDAFTCCYVATGSRDGSSVAVCVRASAFARGVVDFERTLREQLGESRVSRAITQARKKRSPPRRFGSAEA